MKKGTFTSSNAREMQQKAAQKRKANTQERKSARLIVEALLNKTKKNKDGVEVSAKEVMLNIVLKGAVEDGDLRKVDYLLKLIGEAPENVSKLDVTTNGKDMTAPQLVFSPTPLSEKDIQEIQDIQDGRTTDNRSDTGLSEDGSGV